MTILFDTNKLSKDAESAAPSANSALTFVYMLMHIAFAMFFLYFSAYYFSFVIFILMMFIAISSVVKRYKNCY